MILLIKNVNKGLYANKDVLPSYGWLEDNELNECKFSNFINFEHKIKSDIFIVFLILSYKQKLF